jgi:DNA topoisomerase-1
MTELIITEKPSSAKKLAEALADGKLIKKAYKKVPYYELTHKNKEIVVGCAVGHLYGLVEKKKEGWTYPVFEIKWEDTSKTSKGLGYIKDYITVLKKLAKESDEFTVACDYDVEGEVIGWNIIRFTCKKKDASRMKFSTLTKGDLIEAYENKSKTLNWGQAHAGETRHKLDWFYGINLSRALTAAIKAAKAFKIMSIGRVQGPALKMLVDREKAIQIFKPVPFWQLQLLGEKNIEAWHEQEVNEKKIKELMEIMLKEFKKYDIDINEKLKKQIETSKGSIKLAKIFIDWQNYFLKNLKGSKKENFHNTLQELKKALDTNKFWELKEVKKILKKIKGEKTALVKEIKTRITQLQAPHPFDLTTLQTESYGVFRITPKETLAIAQQLYLAGLISYPRTSSQQLDPKLGFKKIINRLGKQKEYTSFCQELSKTKLIPNNGKKTDPAHPAIYPTGSVPKGLKPRENKVYDLIVKRFLATFAEPAERESMNVSLDVKEEIFIAKGIRTVKQGWHKYYLPYVKAEDNELPALKEGEKIKVKNINKLDKETQPPNRFNQSSIIKELEKRNLGTKATRADILDRLFKRGYVDGIQIKITKLGMETIAVLEKHAPTIIDEELTRSFEEEMDLIREGKHTEAKVLEKAKKVLIKLLAAFKKKEKVIGKELLVSIREVRKIESRIGPCPKCKEGTLVMKRGKYGMFIACDKYPDCDATFKIPSNALVKNSEKICETCGYPKVKVIKKGRRPQESCINPDCPSKIKEEDKELLKKFESGELTRNCPKCGKQLVLRKSFYNIFLGCPDFPKCRHMENLDGTKGWKKKVLRQEERKLKK